MSRQYIIAGHMSEFVHWKKKQIQLLGESFLLNQRDIIYVSGPETLKGIRAPNGRFIGTWYRRQDINQIILQLLMAGSIDPDMHDYIITTRDKLNGVEMDLSLYGIKP